MGKNYTVLHLHSSLSLLDSATDFKDYIIKAKEYGMDSIAFTEHGNIFQWVDKKMHCDKEGIKYIHGCEVYLTETHEINVRDNYHTILLAKNHEGFKELNLLVGLATREDHFYYKPRLSFEEFLNISDNIIKISACLNSPLNKLKKANNVMYENLCNHYDYYEIQPHINSKEQIEYNQYLYKLSLKYNKPLIAGTDTHSLNKYKAECRSVLQKAKKIEFTNEDDYDLTFKSYNELVEMFEKQDSLPKAVYLEAIENTNVVADSIESFELDTSFKYPILYDNEEEVFKKRIMDMYKDKVYKGIIKHDKRYLDNIKEELRVFKKIGMIGFMLFMSEMLCWCWENNIPIGTCRGSVGGSTIAYITDIIDVDPVIWDTVFSRFANEDRKEIGDIDIDISPSQRDMVYQYIINRFGINNTSYILAIGTAADKGTIDEIGRALKTPLDEVKQIKELYELNPEKAREQFPNLFYYFDGIVNTPVSQSMHPAGMIASPITLPDNYGTFWNDGKRILTINMEEVHEINLVKYDILGLKNIEIIKDACEFAGIKYPKSYEVNWEDQGVWDDILCSPVGIFQFESRFAFDSMVKFKPQKVQDLDLITAAIRPSGASYRERLFNHEINKNPSKEIDELLKNNNGFLIYQEDVIAFLQKICGLSGSEADNIRRAIGRKQVDRLNAAMPRILEGYCKVSSQPREIAEKEAKEFLQIIEDASSYMFGYNHATGYSMISFMCAYLRYYYPLEFITSYLNNSDTMEDINQGTELAKTKGITIHNIKFGKSKGEYNFDKDTNTIYKGVGSIKNLNSKKGDELFEISQNKSVTSLFDLLSFLEDDRQLKKEKSYSVGYSDLIQLAKLNYFSGYGKSKKILEYIELFKTFYNKKTISKDGDYKIPTSEIAKYCSKETPKQYSEFDYEKLLLDQWDKIEDKTISLLETLDAEKEYLGYIQFYHPKLIDMYYVTEFKVYQQPNKPYLTLYNLANGESIKCRVKNGNNFSLNPFTEKAIILLQSLKQEYKSKFNPYTEDYIKKHNPKKKGEWIKTDEIEWVLDDWDVLSKAKN